MKEHKKAHCVNELLAQNIEIGIGVSESLSKRKIDIDMNLPMDDIIVAFMMAHI